MIRSASTWRLASDALEQATLAQRTWSDEERLAALAAACRAGARLLMLRDDRADVLAFEDPVPDSTRVALMRLRSEHRARQARVAKDSRIVHGR